MNIILDEIEIVENVLTPEDFVRLRTAAMGIVSMINLI